MTLRVATFNVNCIENQQVSLLEQKEQLQSQLNRLEADIVCLQGIAGNADEDTFNLDNLDELLRGTMYEEFTLVSTVTDDGDVFEDKNLVTLTRHDVLDAQQIKHDFVPQPNYLPVTSIPKSNNPKAITWQKPALYTKLYIEEEDYHVINIDLNDNHPVAIPGQYKQEQWQSASGWAEGYFVSLLKQSGQALEIRLFVDEIFAKNPNTNVIICGHIGSESNLGSGLVIQGSVSSSKNTELQNASLVTPTTEHGGHYTKLTAGKKENLDHIYMSQSLLPFYKHMEIHNENLQDTTTLREVGLLEPAHAPKVLQFDI